MGAVAHMAIGALVATVAAPAAAATPTVLQLLSLSEWRSAGVGGTGCWWSVRGDRDWRFAMSGRTAVVKVAGRVVILEPAAGAARAFPFTFDRWRAGATTINVVRRGWSRRSGTEVLREPARVVVVTDGRRAAYAGTLECGS